MDLLIFIVKRAVAAVLVLFAVSILTFLIFFAIPSGDPALRLAGRTARASDIARVRHIFGLDKPMWEQYLHTMNQVLTGKIQDYTQRLPVFSQLKAGLPATFSLAIGAAIIWLLIAVVLGTIGARRAGKATDVVITTINFVGISAPSFVVGSIAIYLLTFKLQIFPSSGYVGITVSPVQWFQHLVLPWFTLAILYIGIYAQVLRSGVIDAMSTDFVRTARAKGLPEWKILVKHVLRVSLIPIVSLWGLDFASVLGGSTLIVETVFNLNGAGEYIGSSIGSLDIPPVLVGTLLGACFVVVMNAIVDVLYAVLDPRIRAGGS